MLEFGNKEWRNLQEQVGKNKEDIKTLKSGIKIEYEVANIVDLSPLLTQENVGKYVLVRTEPQKLYLITKRANGGLIAVPIGNFPEVVEGPKGDKGDTGDKGDNGTKVGASSGTTLPSPDSYKEGDLFILGTGMLYKLVQGKWYAQCDLKGPQGLRGPQGTAVTANPVEEPSDVLTKVKIDGIVYNVEELSSAEKSLIEKLDNAISFGLNNEIIVDEPVSFSLDIDVGGDIETSGKIIVSSFNNIEAHIGGVVDNLGLRLNAKELSSNKVQNLDNPSSNTYPSTAAVKNYVDSKITTTEKEMLENLTEYTQFDEDGGFIVGNDLEVDGNIKVNGIENLTDKDGQPLAFNKIEVATIRELKNNDIIMIYQSGSIYGISASIGRVLETEGSIDIATSLPMVDVGESKSVIISYISFNKDNFSLDTIQDVVGNEYDELDLDELSFYKIGSIAN